MGDKRNVTMIAIVVLLTYLTWKYFSSSSMMFSDWVDIAPYAYRMNWYFVSFLGNFMFSSTTWLCGSWIISLVLVYLIIPKTGESEIIFMLWLVAISAFGTIFDGPAFVFLALIMKYKKSKYCFLLFIPLILFKEIIAFIAFVALFLGSDKKIRLSLSVIPAGMAYLLFRLFVGTKPQAVGGLFLPVIPAITTSFVFVFWIPIMIVLIALSFTKQFTKLWLITGIVLCVFALPWEPQLWFPLVIIQMLEKRRTESDSTSDDLTGTP